MRVANLIKLLFRPAAVSGAPAPLTATQMQVLQHQMLIQNQLLAQQQLHSNSSLATPTHGDESRDGSDDDPLRTAGDGVASGDRRERAASSSGREKAVSSSGKEAHSPGGLGGGSDEKGQELSWVEEFTPGTYLWLRPYAGGGLKPEMFKIRFSRKVS